MSYVSFDSLVARASDWAAGPARAGGAMARLVVRQIDRQLRRSEHIVEYSGDPRCVLRLAMVAAATEVQLADGARIRRDDLVIELHLWNEHLPPTPKRGPSLAWSLRLAHLLTLSLKELADRVRRDPSLAAAKAIRARFAFARHGHAGGQVRLGLRLGFELVRPPPPPPLRRAHDLFENLWLVALGFAFNPRSLRRNALLRERNEFWMSTAGLLERYGERSADRR